MVQRARALILSPDRSTVVVGIPLPRNPAVFIKSVVALITSVIIISGGPTEQGLRALRTLARLKVFGCCRPRGGLLDRKSPRARFLGRAVLRRPSTGGLRAGRALCLRQVPLCCMHHCPVPMPCGKNVSMINRGQVTNPCAGRYQVMGSTQQEDALAAYKTLQAL